MPSAYAAIAASNLKAVSFDNIEHRLPAERRNGGWHFAAFGRPCRLTADTITLANRPETGVPGVLISLYARHATVEPCRCTPFQAFKQLPDSMPYAGAFASHCERILVPAVDRILAHLGALAGHFGGGPAPVNVGGDGAMVVYPLPKIALCYIFYRADEDFDASATCLFSANAHRLLPTDALADVGETTSRTILDLLDTI